MFFILHRISDWRESAVVGVLFCARDCLRDVRVIVCTRAVADRGIQPTSASFSRLRTEPGHYSTWQELAPAATEPGWRRLQAMQAKLAAAAAGTEKMTATGQQLQTKSRGKVLQKRKA